MFKGKRKIGARWLLAAFSLTQGVAHGQEWTEQAVLSLFDRQNPMQRETRASAAAAVEEIRGRTLWPNPVARYSRETVGFTEFVDAQQELPLSGRLGYIKKAIDPGREVVEAQGAARVWEVRSSIRAAFYRALAAQQQAETIQAALSDIEQIVTLLRTREREGEGSRYDRIRVERETVDLRADVAVARAKARAELTFLLAYLPQQTAITSLSGALVPLAIARSKDEIFRAALSSRAEFKAEASRQIQLSFEQQAADRLRIPEPTITAGLKRIDPLSGQRGNGAVIGFSIPLPIFNKGRTEVARIGAEKERGDARRDILTQQVTATIAGAYEVYAARLAALNTYEQETTGRDAELLRIARAGYQDGELGILQVLDAYRMQRVTAIRRLELASAVKESEVELSRAAGFEVTQ